jgi:hypothetical protein
MRLDALMSFGLFEQSAGSCLDIQLAYRYKTRDCELSTNSRASRFVQQAPRQGGGFVLLKTKTSISIRIVQSKTDMTILQFKAFLLYPAFMKVRLLLALVLRLPVLSVVHRPRYHHDALATRPKIRRI